MNTHQLRPFFVILLLGFGMHATVSSENLPAKPATESHSKSQQVGVAETEQVSDAAQYELPSIMNEDDVPAFLRTDPCDSGDS